MNLLRNRTVLGVICIVLSLLICFGITPMFNREMSQKTEIIRVTKDITLGEEITDSMIEIVEVGGYNLPSNVIKAKGDVLGRYALADFSQGDYILDGKISETLQEENAYLYNLNGEKQAMSISIQNFANGLSGKLESGDIVSVIAPNFMDQGITTIPQELKYVEVISVTAETGTDANTGEEYTEENERELPSTVTLLVTPEQGNLLADLEVSGAPHLSLVYRGDAEKAKEFIAIQDEIIQKTYHPNSPIAGDDTVLPIENSEVE